MMDYMREYEKWLHSGALTADEVKELEAIAGDEKEIESRFYGPLEFGTAGLRGTMKVGLHQMNVYVIRWATQGFANVICAEGEKAKQRGVAICMDCRHHSMEFARAAAEVCAANGIHVRIFASLRPTPELSFAVREYGCQAGINVTASHNPKEYNGYKVYWSDGAQLPPQHAAAIAEQMNKIDIFRDFVTCDFDEAVADGRIEMIGAETDEAYLACVLGQAINKDVVASVADKLKIIYTPFHGAGYKLVPEALKRLGVTRLYPVPEQMVLDGNFSTVESPNPENPEGFYLAVALAKKVGSDLIIGTDPDSDRIGVMVRDGEDYTPITGNQLGILLLDYIINARREAGTLPENSGAVKSIVTTEMAKVVAETNGVHFEDTFTGFKFMAERVAEWEKAGTYKYIFAYEESYGYMMGDYVRDKDAVTASMMVAEMAAHYHKQGMTLLDAMESLYEKYGWFMEKTVNLVMPGVDGLQKMKALMEELRSQPPKEIEGEEVVRLRDYLDGSIHVAGLGVVGKTPFWGSNVLYFELKDGSSFIIRPSGTEPKIKVYLLIRGGSKAECEERIEKYLHYVEVLKR